MEDMTKAMPWMQENVFSSKQQSIMSMRWENKDLINQLWLNLAYLEPQTINGKKTLQPVQGKHERPPMNRKGARAVINIVQSFINPVVSLSKMHQDKADQLIKHTKQALRFHLATNMKAYEIENGSTLETIYSIVQNVLVAQFYRPVGGHESGQSRMNLVEQRGDFTTTTGNKGWKIFGGKE